MARAQCGVVELLVVLDDLRRTFEVALNEAAHRFVDRMFGESAHLTDQRAQPFDVFIEGLKRMSAGLLHCLGSDQPYRPVI